MRSRRLSLGVLLALAVVLQSFSQIQRSRTPLPIAIATGQARGSIRGNGGSSGASIDVTLAKGPNAPEGPLEISIPPGTTLSNSNSAGQNMVVGEVLGKKTGEMSYSPTSRIVLMGTATSTYVLSAFCLNFEKDNPSESDAFTAEKPDTTLACIMKKSLELSIPARQAAVWIHTDNLSYSQMNEKFQVSPSEFAQGQSVVDICQ
jgi:hypothetical protein